MEKFLDLLNELFRKKLIAIDILEFDKNYKIAMQTIFKGGILDLSKITIISNEAHKDINDKLYNLLVAPRCSITGLKLHSSEAQDYIETIFLVLKANKSLKSLNFSDTSFGNENCEKLIPILRKRQESSGFHKLTLKLDNCWLEKSNLSALEKYADVEISGASDQ